MSLSDSNKKIICELVEENLDRAERIWDEVGHEFLKVSMVLDEAIFKMETKPSEIPGHEFVNENTPVVDNFIAMVIDMRDSSRHLMQAISPKVADVSQLQRVFYETSALLPALAMTTRFENGRVTEYLGDGVLALFRVEDPIKNAVYAAHRAAKNCIGDTREIVNKALCKRYRLPSLDLGVGMSSSKALVTLVGLSGSKQPKAIGECVYRATKLAFGVNKIIVDAFVEGMWPTTKNGGLKFTKTQGRSGVEGFIIN